MRSETPANERIAVVDVLRAFALFGIIVTHAASGYLAGPPPAPGFNVFGAADRIVDNLENLLTFGKFFTIFAFLFGLSFAIQLDNAARKGTSFAGRFAWRVILLFAIGFVHQMFFSGDILTIYAVLGLLLIPFQKVPTRVLLVAGLLLVLNVPGLVRNLRQVSAPPPTAEQRQAAAAAGQAFMQHARQQYDIKRTGGVDQVIRMNVTEGFGDKFRFQVVTGRLWVTFGLFLLGLCAGRLNIFRDSAENRRFFRRLGLASGVIAALATAAYLAHPPVGFAARSVTQAFTSFAFSVQQFTLAACYASVIALLFWRRPTGLLSQLAPMGKMGLTTYLTQSVFGLLLFYGFGLGLLGKLGVAACVMLAMAFYIVQIMFASWWLRHFSMGPVEWLWRSLTYFRLQPLARPALPAT
jgi:uncharacterized protein